MLRELLHLAQHAPATLALKRKLPQAELYDLLITRSDAAGLAERRKALVSDLRGDVLEIGCGTGFMFAHYSDAAHVVAVDMDDAFIERARARGRANIEVKHADAQSLPFSDESFDAVVMCLVCCSIPDAPRALVEMRRVLKPGGELRAIEHVVSEHAVSAALMHVVDPLWLWINAQGCHLDRDTIEQARAVFGEIAVDRFQLFSAGLPAFPMCTIKARR